jgi:hypothetical protein
MGSSRLPSFLLIDAGDIMEASDVCGLIIMAKALAEPSRGSAADMAHIGIVFN